MDKPIKLFFLSVLLFIILSGSITYYFYDKNQQLNLELEIVNKKLDKTKTVLESTISNVDNKITGRINTFYSEYSSFKGDLTGQVTNLETDIETVSTETQQQFTNIEGQITEVSAKSEELADQLANIEFKTADFSNIIEDAVKSVVSIGTNNGIGSGVIVRSDGFIVTNYHVVKDATSAGIKTYDGIAHSVAMIAYDDNLDLALLRIFNVTYPKMDFADSDRAKVGQNVIAIGNPGGLDFTVTEGIISALEREVNGKEYIQTDVPINPGNSGGPLVDTSGRMLGINTVKASGFEGIGFAIPSDDVKAFVNNNLPA